MGVVWLQPDMNKTTHKIFRFILRLILHLIARVEVSGFENMPAAQGFVIAANHIGRLDAAMPYYFLDRPDIIVMVAEKYQKICLDTLADACGQWHFHRPVQCRRGSTPPDPAPLAGRRYPDHDPGRDTLQIRQLDRGQTWRDLPGLEGGCAHLAGCHHRHRGCGGQDPSQAFQTTGYQDRRRAILHAAFGEGQGPGCAHAGVYR